MNHRILKAVQVPFLIAALALFNGCQKKQETTQVVSSSGGGIVSAERTSFDAVTAKLDKGGNLYIYASTAQLLGNLSQNIEKWSNTLTSLPLQTGTGGMNKENIARVFGLAGSLIGESGIEQVDGFGASSIAREPGFYFNKAVLYHEEGKDEGLIWSLAGKKSHELKELDLLPLNTAFATYSDFDVALLWQTVQKELGLLNMPDVDQKLAQFPAQFKAGTGISLDDALGSLGGGSGFLFTLDEGKMVNLPIPNAPMEIPEPGMAIFIKVKDDVIFNRIDQALDSSQAAAMVTKSDRSDVKIRTVTIPVPLPVDVSPTIARFGDYLFVTSSRKLFDEIYDVQGGKKPGYKSTDEFKKLSQGIPLEGNNFTLISEKFGKNMSKAMEGVLSKQPALNGGQAEMIRQMLATNSSMYAFSVSANGPDGWEALANGNKSMNAMFIPVAAGGVAVGAAIALPAMAKARQAPQFNRITANLRNIDVAKAQFVAAKTLADGNPVTMEDIAPYLSQPITSVAGEFYMPNPVGVPAQARLNQAMNGHAAGSTITAADQ